MAEKLEKFYGDVLRYFGAEADSSGVIRSIDTDSSGNTAPIVLNESSKGLLMPSPAGMKMYDAQKYVVFHPLREYIDRGESEVVKKLRTFISLRINIALFALMSGLVSVAASPRKHQQLTPEQREMILGLPDLKPDSVEALIKVFGKLMETSTTPFVSIFLKKAGKYKGQIHARVGVTNLVFREKLEAAGLKTLRKADAEAFPAILEYIFQGYVDDAEAYNSFSDSKDFPWFDCLLKTSYVITSRINEVIDLFAEHLPEEVLEVRFHHDWVETLDNIGTLSKEISLIPVQKGNEGEIEVKAEAKAPPPRPVPEQRRYRESDRDRRYPDEDVRDHRRDERSRQESSEDGGFIDFDQLMGRSRELQDRYYDSREREFRDTRRPLDDRRPPPRYYDDRRPIRDVRDRYDDRYDDRYRDDRRLPPRYYDDRRPVRDYDDRYDGPIRSPLYRG